MDDNDDEFLRGGNYLDAKEYGKDGEDYKKVEVVDYPTTPQPEDIDVYSSVNNDTGIPMEAIVKKTIQNEEDDHGG